MTDSWKSIERLVAELLGGVRSWNSEDDIDVLVPDDKNPEWGVEVKWWRAITVAQIEGWLTHNAVKCDARGIKNALVVKRKAGRGSPTPFLLVIPVIPIFAQDVEQSVNDTKENGG